VIHNFGLIMSSGLMCIVSGRIGMKGMMLKKTAVFLISVTLFSLLGFLVAPKASAVPSISISPLSGFVGETLMVNGTIDTTDGSFTVRWNQAFNVTGVAAGNATSVSFPIPPTVGAPYPSGRNVTVELIDEALDVVVAATNFTLFTKFDMQVETPESPKQLQEGTTVRLNATVAGGEPNTVYAANITVRNTANQTHWVSASLSNTTTSGSGSVAVVYPLDFTAGANMNYTGAYKAFLNDTLVEREFSVGLTDKTEYRRNEDVLVRAAGYKPSEAVNVDMRTGESSVSGFPKNINATSGGLVTLTWKVPLNAAPGTYTIALSNTTSGGTVKTPNDAQNFNVTGVVCLIQTRNLADEAYGGALIEVYNVSAPTSALITGSTNSTGWVRFNLESGNYTFKAFVKNVEVGALLNQTITEDTEFPLELRLVNFTATVETEGGKGMPLIDVTLNYNYTTRDNKTVAVVATAQTNITGVAAIRNLFTNVTYEVEAKRYGLLFNATTLVVESSPSLGWISLDLTLPTYTLSVHALDSKDSNAAGVVVRVYEWASGVTTPVQSMETNLSGDAFFSLLFGRYVLGAYAGDNFLSETVIDLDKPSAFTLNLVTLNVDVTVSVFDFFGRPIANAEVKLERKSGQDFALVMSQFTDSGGVARFTSIVGGESRLSVYAGGKLVGVQTQFLGFGSSEASFSTGEYVALFGYPIATGAFALLIFVILVFVIVALAMARKRISKVLSRKSKR